MFSPSGWGDKNQHRASSIADVRAIYRRGHGHVRDLKEAKHLGTFQSSGRARAPAHPQRKPHLRKRGNLPSLNTIPTRGSQGPHSAPMPRQNHPPAIVLSVPEEE